MQTVDLSLGLIVLLSAKNSSHGILGDGADARMITQARLDKVDHDGLMILLSHGALHGESVYRQTHVGNLGDLPSLWWRG